MLFQQSKLRVRSLEERDKLILAKWLSDPSVLEFYEGRDRPFDVNKVETEFFQHNDDVTGFMVEYDGVRIGYIQFYVCDDYGYADELIYGIDQFIGEPSYWNRGIGTLLVSSMAVFLCDHKQAERVVMDPHVTNERAIRCYEKSGFKKVKLLPKHEWHEGAYRECWLMEYCNPSGESV
ncbi:GNAT family N-acetyltransferase [Thalassobacillus sp. CUG 92003]|uniref:GNAT family N-acetyltransferase n=1 Tax=Thalassobacillus sp. CUG 92003 TaxID=2736641 RepID=UPI0015E78E87|nr:GNAT family N-acetyltransferase [Thalassobacillus sp. CUG 92003]